jgi:hypothetical protein
MTNITLNSKSKTLKKTFWKYRGAIFFDVVIKEEPPNFQGSFSSKTNK